jgi:DNA-binding transcriptional LysR family regulator
MILLGAGQRCYFDRSFDTHMVQALKAMVIDGHGLGWLPESCVEREISEGKLVLSGTPQWSSSLEVRLYRTAESDNVTVNKIWASLLGNESKHL